MASESFTLSSSQDIEALCTDWLRKRQTRIRTEQKKFKRNVIQYEMNRRWPFKAKTVKQALRRIDYSFMGSYCMLSDRGYMAAGRVAKLRNLARSSDKFMYVTASDMYTLTQTHG